MQHVIANLIEERRLAPQNDFISTIQNSDLTMNELVYALYGTILAGHVTTTDLIGNALKILLEQQLWQTICNDPSVIPAALEEVLRYDTPVPSMIRTTTQEVEFAGVTLPKGALIFLLFSSGNRDECQYSNATEFDISRFQQTPVNHLAFGGNGPHFCVGSSLARREGRIALEILSKRLPNLRLSPNQEFTRIPAMIKRGFTHLYLEWDVT